MISFVFCSWIINEFLNNFLDRFQQGACFQLSTYHSVSADYCQRRETVPPRCPCDSKQTDEPVERQIDHVSEEIKMCMNTSLTSSGSHHFVFGDNILKPFQADASVILGCLWDKEKKSNEFVALDSY